MKTGLFLFFAFILAATNTDAQCPAGRYNTELFPTVSKSTVTYSTPYNLLMDIYEPAGDVLAARPLIILAHGGSFVFGSRSDDETVDSLCVRFARRGYVTVSIDYRLATFGEMTSSDSTLPTNAVFRAISDGKAAIRYFVKDAATTNTYRIDTNNIFVGGNSAGAILYMHVAYLSDTSECPPHILAAINANGGFEGNSGNAGYTTKTRAAINLAGALNRASFIGYADKPSVNFHGTADNTVPYNCGYPLGGACRVQLCGLGVLEPALAANDVYYMSRQFPGDGHVPWQGDPAKFKTVDSLTTIFLHNVVCSNVASVNEATSNIDISIFPNPAREQINLSATHLLLSVVLVDATGRIVAHALDIHNTQTQLDVAKLPKGLYTLKAEFADSNNIPVVRRFLVN